MFSPPHQWILAALLATVVVAVAYILRRLSKSGAFTAVLLGTAIVGTGGWWPGVILVVFFVTASLLSQSGGNQARGSRRDWVQVLANGWGMLLGCLAYAATGWVPWLFFGIGAIAAATADTWSSEIGRTSTTPPRLITSFKIVSPGTSGAVSVRGIQATIAGAALIGLLATLAMSRGALGDGGSLAGAFFGITIAGICGGLMDSILGATVQERRWCESCDVSTESNPHICGTVTQRIGGVAGIDNDVVNFLCGLTGALAALLSSIL